MTQVAVFDSASLPLVEELFAKFQQDPESVGPEWKAYFLGWQAAGSVGGAAGGEVMPLAEAWRMRGHLVAHTNPFKDYKGDLPEELKGADSTRWQAIYGGSIGVECGVVREPAERAWVQDWWENKASGLAADKSVKARLYKGLVEAGGLERMLHTKFVGVKRFSVEGNDGVVPVLQELARIAAENGAKHVVMGMAHRGRLNVLCNVLHKPYAELFAAFADKLEQVGGPSSGDVKYHLGKVYNADIEGKNIELQLLYNPSHLEAVNPSVLGVARAKGEAAGGFEKVVPVLIHGDSAVAGQGVVAECNNLMNIKAYGVGGTLHFVLNNQVGFTANPDEAYGGRYCTEVFEMLGVPIVHVNADDIEACWKALRFAWDYRSTFHKDVVLEFIGYRKWGHNEGDDPTFTQPVLYETIKNHPAPDALYAAKLKADGVFGEAELAKITQDFEDTLKTAFDEAQKGVKSGGGGGGGAAVRGNAAAETGIGMETVRQVATTCAKPPKGFVWNSKVERVWDERLAMWAGEKPLNWGAAEVMAYGSLLAAGVDVRLCGQDAQRGTFSHRHAVVVSGADGARWNMLEGLGGRAMVYNSALTENAGMGFEYGYALGKPENSLVVWEGQFGDFANGAQVVIDQFLASAKVKWGQDNHLVLLLPHGYEGQGPEHSSARLERYLQLCAEDNMRVCHPTTPAQIFHLLRGQALNGEKKPLVVMTPKSLLRLPAAVSTLSDLLDGAWRPVLADTFDPKTVKKVVLCSGKIYYDLAARRDEDGREDVALIRVEQLYPWPAEAIADALKGVKARDVTWVQEEPRNMGAWAHVRENWDDKLGYLHYVGRPARASTAVGSMSRHKAEQEGIVEDVFGIRETRDKKQETR